MGKIIPYLLITLILYLMFSFVPMQFNPNLWSKEDRLFFVFIWTGCMLIIPMIKGMMGSLKEK